MTDYWSGYIVGMITGAVLVLLAVRHLPIRWNVSIRVRRDRVRPSPPPVHTWEMTTREDKPRDAE